MRARDEELGRDDDDADDDDDGYEENAPLVVKRSEVAAADAAESAPSSSSRGELTRGMLLYALGVACASITALTARLMHDLGVPVHWVVLLRACAGVTMVSSRWRGDGPVASSRDPSVDATPSYAFAPSSAC